MLFLSIMLNVFSSYFLAAIFNSFIVFALLFIALIIINLEILSLFDAIIPINILILQTFFFLCSFFFFIYKKCPKISLNFNFKKFKNSLLLDKSLIVLFVAFIFMLTVQGFLAYIIPASEADSQTYHFFRSYMFVKLHSLAHFETGDIRALVMPINSEILYSWILSFKKNFWGYNLVSYFSFFLVLISSWNIMEKFKIAYRKRLFSIFIFSSLSAIIIQISSMQTDLLVGALLLSSLALFLDNSKKSIYFSSLSYAIALGVKTTAIFSFLALIFIFIFCEFLIDKKKTLPKTKLFILFLIPNFLIFSSYNYILNFLQFGNFISNEAAMAGHGFWGGTKGYISNLINFIFQWFDFTGFLWGFYLNDYILGIKHAVYNFLNINPDVGVNSALFRTNIFAEEQTSGFGILGFLVFIPMIFKSIFSFLKHKSNKRSIFLGLLGLAFIINFLVLGRAMAYMVYSIRFFVTFCALSFVVLTLAYTKKNNLYKIIIIIFCLFYMTLISTHTRRAPLKEITAKLKSYDYNLETFEKNFFLGHVYLKSLFIEDIYNMLNTKYKDKKNIAFIKTTNSVVFYIKKLENKSRKIDFLNPALITEEKLKKYDLVIVENQRQDDSVFNKKDIELNNINFSSNKTPECFFAIIDENTRTPVSRYCYTFDFITKNTNFKIDYSQKTIIKELKKSTTLYYFVKKSDII